MQLQRQVYTYYKRKMYKGRSAFARAADFFFLRLFFFAAVYIVCIYSLRIIWLSLFMAAALTVSISLALHIYKGFKLGRFIDAELGHLKKECLLENIVMMNASEYRILSKKILEQMGYTDVSGVKTGYTAKKDGQATLAKVFFMHPSEKAGVNEVISAYKTAKGKNIENLLLLTTSAFNKEAQVFAKRQENITLIESETFLELAVQSGFAVNDEEANDAAMQAIRNNAVTPEDIRDAALGKGKAKAYMLCGIFALVWSYVSGFRFYYPIIAIVCFVLAFYIHRREQMKAQKKS